ncbi:hypothetical protein NUW58_g890 [Xylaria curta]|uniref:Uncharacterized protein n=1 Tax=Xylaria curta TaxID=42375 RepID=A0ACC1PNP9_9PEZI|nr:hypothetical protein NUW58_g890 [Xylaria curta]
MKIQFPTILLGLSAARAVSAQITEIHQEGPFALRVKGQAPNSSINGYFTWYNLKGVSAPSFISYEPLSYPMIGNSSFEWYFNYTGLIQYRGHEVGYLLANPTANTTTPSPYRGQPLDLSYKPNSNVGIALLGIGGAFDAGFDADNKTFSTSEFDDATYLPGVPPEYSEDLGYYRWAVCWELSGYYRQTLSWITVGEPHNPTCEFVDLMRVKF